jgi:hypothetical protein
MDPRRELVKRRDPGSSNDDLTSVSNATLIRSGPDHAYTVQARSNLGSIDPSADEKPGRRSSGRLGGVLDKFLCKVTCKSDCFVDSPTLGDAKVGDRAADTDCDFSVAQRDCGDERSEAYGHQQGGAGDFP